MKFIKKMCLSILAIGLLLQLSMSTISEAYEVEIDHDGIYWVETDAIRSEGDILSVLVYYGKNHNRKFTWQFKNSSGWLCKNPGHPHQWQSLEPSDNDILYVVLSNR